MPLNEPSDFEKVLQDAFFEDPKEPVLPEVPLCTTENCPFESAERRQDALYTVITQCVGMMYQAIGTLQAHGEVIGPIALRGDLDTFVKTVDTYLHGVGFYQRHGHTAQGDADAGN